MVRKAVKEDVTSIAQMAAMMWDVHSVEELAREFETLIENEECEIYVCCVDNMAIGFAQCGLRHDYVEGTESSPVGYLEGIFVCEEYRKKGYARGLLDECEKWARQKGCSEFASDCELNNDVSLDFHMHAGFMEVNRIICFTKQI